MGARPQESESPPDPSSAHGPPRKKMRKGTKSCLECRRRKIKCTFDVEGAAVCKECHARGSACVDQEHGHLQPSNPALDHTYSLRERMTHLEDVVREVLGRLPDAGDRRSSTSSSLAADTHSAAVVLKSLRNPPTLPAPETSLILQNGLREDAPTLSLFDNAVLTRKDEPPHISRDRYNKNKALSQTLTAMLPGPQELDIILDVSETWWAIWRKMFLGITDSRCTSFKETISQSLRSENPAEVAKMILCIAISIDQLPGDWDFSQLRMDGSPQELMERYIATVDELITSDDEIAGTVDGIECMCLQAKYYINIGRPRRAWHIFRRAISFAQLLGFHRLALMKTAKPDLHRRRQLSLWALLFQGERYLALTLGLPLCIPAQFCDPCIPAIGEPTERTDGEAFMLRLSPFIARVVDRNQNPSLDFSLTLRIDQDMDELAHSVPSAWWGKTEPPVPNMEEHYDRLLAQFFFHLVRKLLHLPFMLKSSSDSRYLYSYTAALDSSRHMIRFYDALRGGDIVGPYICKVIDFQAFSAAVLILLNLYGYSDDPRTSNVEQDQLDSALVDTTIKLLRKASKEAGGIVAAQSLKALEMIAEARHGCAEEAATARTHQATVKVCIPYFGTLTIGAGKKFNVPKKGTYSRTAGKTQSTERASGAGPAAAPPNSGLPTPPSATHPHLPFSPPPSLSSDPSSTTTSMLPSPYDTNTLPYSDPSPPPGQQNTSFSVDNNNNNNHNHGNFTSANDPLISFDSYVAVPPIGGGGMNMDPFFPEMNPGVDLGPDMGGIGAFPGWGVGLDLDHNWNWFDAGTVALGDGPPGAKAFQQ